jgi:uncharacterized membrane protein YcaP (DUF421 family)
MGFFDNSYVQIALSSLAVYLFIIVAFRIMGKKEISQLSVVDLVFILLISNAVQNAMVGSNTSLSGGLVAAASLFAANYLFKQILFRFPKLGGFIQGEALVLIYDGKLLQANVAKARIPTDEIMEALREHGVSRIGEVDLAVLEADGNISVLSNEYQKKSVRKRRSRPRNQPGAQGSMTG